MIMKTKECYNVFKKDIARYFPTALGGGNILNICKLSTMILVPTNLSIAFSFWFRMCRSNNVLIRSFSKFMRIRLSRRYGVQIHPSTEIGFGLMIPHLLPLVVYPKTVIGNNATIHQFVTIAGDGAGHAPIIGNNCFIGSGATVIGGLNIGNNVTIAAGAVVVRDIPDNATVGGIPAKIIHFNHPGEKTVNPID